MNERIEELILALKDMGIKQYAFAEKIGVTESTVSGWKIGRRNITEQSIRAICREFNVREEWLREGTGGMFLELQEDQYAKAAALLSDDPLFRTMATEYFKLDDDSRKLFRDFVERLYKGMQGRDEPAPAPSEKDDPPTS